MSAPTKTVWNSIWPYLLLCGLCTIFLADVLFAGKILFLRDVFAGVVPTWTLIHDAIHAGRLPLWNPFVACGVPLAGDPYTQLFYPPFWLFIFFPTEIALRLFLWFHLILAAISVYALCRHWRLDVSASLLAGISFALSTFSVGWLEFTTGLACLSLAALSFIIVDTLFERCRCFLHAGMPKLAKSVACPLAALGVLFFLQIVAAGEWFYYCSLFVGAFCLWQFFALRTLRANLLACVCIGIAVALGLTLAAPQVLPTLGAMQMSIRAGEVDAALHMTSAHPRHWLSFILPFFYGKPGYPDSYWAPTIYEFVNGTCYIGILPLLMLPFAFLFLVRRKTSPERARLTVFLAIVVLGALAMAAGKYFPLYPFLHRHLPGLGHVRFATKFYAFVALFLPLLGAVGYQALIEIRDERAKHLIKRIWMALCISLLVLFIGYLAVLFSPDLLHALMNYPHTPSADKVSMVYQDYLYALVFFAAGTALLAMPAFEIGKRRIANAMIVGMAFLNLWVISRQTQPVVKSGTYERKPLQVLQRIGQGNDYRVFAPQTWVQQYVYGESREEMLRWAEEVGIGIRWSLHGISEVRPGGLPVQRYSVIYGLLSAAEAATREKAADLLNVRFVVTGPPFEQVFWRGAPQQISVFERQTWLPRMFTVEHWRVASGEEETLRTLFASDFDLHRGAVVETTPGALTPESGKQPGEAHGVQNFADKWNSVSADVSVSRQSLLVLNDTFHPGWTVKVDKKEKSIVRVNSIFRGVFIEPGQHHVEFAYFPAGLVKSLWISSVGIAACLLLAAYGLASRHESAEVAAKQVARPARIQH